MRSPVTVESLGSYACTNEIRALVTPTFEANTQIAERRPDRFVVVKPNCVHEAHEYENQVWEPVITPPQLPGEPRNE